MDAALLMRIDVLHVAIAIGGNEKTLRQALRSYLDQAQKSLGLLERSIASQNILIWLQTTQALKTISETMTAKRIAGLCDEALHIQSLPHEHAVSVLYHLEKEVAILSREIGDLAHEH